MHRLASLSSFRSGPRGLTVLRTDPQEVETSRTPLDPTECVFETEPGKANVWIARATWGFVALGLLVRLVRFLVVYPIWPDEAFVAANLLNRDYLGLLTTTRIRPGCPDPFPLDRADGRPALRPVGVVAPPVSYRLRPGELGAVSPRGRCASCVGFPCYWLSGYLRPRRPRSATVPRSNPTHRTCWPL